MITMRKYVPIRGPAVLIILPSIWTKNLDWMIERARSASTILILLTTIDFVSKQTYPEQLGYK